MPPLSKEADDGIRALGRPASKDEGDAHRRDVAKIIEEAWKQSPYSLIVATCETAENPNDGINCRFETVVRPGGVVLFNIFLTRRVRTR